MRKLLFLPLLFRGFRWGLCGCRLGCFALFQLFIESGNSLGGSNPLGDRPALGAELAPLGISAAVIGRDAFFIQKLHSAIEGRAGMFQLLV